MDTSISDHFKEKSKGIKLLSVAGFGDKWMGLEKTCINTPKMHEWHVLRFVFFNTSFVNNIIILCN